MGYSARYERSNVLKTQNIDQGDGTSVEYLQYFNDEYYSLLDNIRSFNPYQNVRRLPITTIAQNELGTTTLWWLIVVYNGYLNALNIDIGNILSIPQRQDVDSIFSSLPKSNKGTTVEI